MKVFDVEKHIGTPTMLEGFPLTCFEMLLIDILIGKDILDLESLEEAYNAVILFEKKYGTSQAFSTQKRAEFLWWFIFSDYEESPPWLG